MGLGSAITVSLSDARQKRDECKKFLADKIDPIEARKNAEAKAKFEAASKVTFEECARFYVEAHKAEWKNAKHAQQFENTLKAYAYPIIGEMSVQDIDVNSVVRVLEPIWETKTETADRVRGRIKKVLDAAKARGLRTGENPATWDGNLDHLFSSRRKLQKVKHHPALPYSGIGDFMALLKEQSGIDALALRFTILNASRTNEALSARWEEIDEAKRIWIIPAERMKAGREHRVPLTNEAISVLRAAYAFTNKTKISFIQDLPKEGWVFQGYKKGRPLSNMAMAMLLRRLNRRDITVHGFRSTFRDWAAEQTAFPREVAEAALAHAIDNKVEAAYFRSDLLEKRERLMSGWSEYCSVVSYHNEGNIVVLRAI